MISSKISKWSSDCDLDEVQEIQEEFIVTEKALKIRKSTTYQKSSLLVLMVMWSILE
jgi:hypothetical protein